MGADTRWGAGLRSAGGRLVRLFGASLASRLVVLTIAFVMLSEVLIYVPSVARHWASLLADRIDAAELVALPLGERPDEQLPLDLRAELLASAGLRAVVIRRAEMNVLVTAEAMPPRVDATVDLARSGAFERIVYAYETLVSRGTRTLRVIGMSRSGSEPLEIIIDEAPLRAALVAYSWNILQLSLLISVLTASLVFLSLYFMLVRPMERMTRAMVAFRANPEDAGRVVVPSGRRDEIGIAESELAAMQGELRAALAQKTRLAQLGGAVARIQHDLRNILASAQLASERLERSQDPAVKRVAPKLIGAIDRAIGLATDTLRFGRADEPPPQKRTAQLAALVAEAADLALAGTPPGAAVSVEIDSEFTIDADRDQMIRVLMNLVRNAAEALSRRADGRIAVSARHAGADTIIEVADNGPGLPDAAVARLFEPFAGSRRAGGTGLGLAIAQGIVRAHGGTLDLTRNGPDGATFRITLPAAGARAP